jgi:hypothetical protein
MHERLLEALDLMPHPNIERTDGCSKELLSAAGFYASGWISGVRRSVATGT